MKESSFDNQVRKAVEGMTFEAPDLWPELSKKLARKHRLVVLRRVSFAAVAAAACLAAAVLIFRDRTPGQQPVAPVQVAEVHPTQQTPVPEEIPPIAEQIEQFTGRQTVARNTKPAAPAATQVEPKAEETAQPDETPVQDEPEVTGPSSPASVEEPATPSEPSATEPKGQLGQEDLPAGFWDEDNDGRYKTHTSTTISILSNLTTVASDGDLIFEAAPTHASSQNGSSQASSPVTPFSESPKFYSPIAVGVQASLPLSDRLSATAGLSYTYLVSQYDILYDSRLVSGAYNQLHYVGVPVSLSYHLVQTPSFGFYAAAGGALEKCVYQRYVFENKTVSEKVSGFQASAHLGLGAEYWFGDHTGIYFDPSLVYYFDNKQPLSIRTQQPLQARFEIGFRFRF